MSIRNALVLDHFYIGVSDEQFQMLLPLADSLKSCFNKHVKSGDDSWEGIYLSSRTGAYFEILRERRSESLGLAFSAYRPQYCDVMQIKDELKDLDWKSYQRNWEDNSPWFDSLSLGSYCDVQETFFNAWLMQYHFNPRPVDSLVPLSVRAVDRFQTIDLELGKRHLDEVRKLSSWFPGVLKFENDNICFRLPDRDGSTFEVNVKLVDADVRFRFKSLKMRRNPEESVHSMSLGDFVFSVEGDVMVLKMVGT